MNYNIAIDGPAGAGKSTIARILAKDLEFIYVDTGAMYRAMTLYLMEKGIGAEDGEKIKKACADADITIAYKDGEQQVILNGKCVNSMIRTEEVGNMTSASSKNPDIREKMTALQKKLAASENVVMDGRDIGTTVLPDAFLKIYLTADSRVRAERRYLELEKKGIKSDLNEIEKDIRARDEQDMNREISPLRQAEDAVLLDSSDLSIEEVADKIKKLFLGKKGSN